MFLSENSIIWEKIPSNELIQYNAVYDVAYVDFFSDLWVASSPLEIRNLISGESSVVSAKPGELLADIDFYAYPNPIIGGSFSTFVFNNVIFSSSLFSSLEIKVSLVLINDLNSFYEVLAPYLNAFKIAYRQWYNKEARQVDIIQAWVNFMKAGEANPPHIHNQCNFSSVLYTDIPKGLIKENLEALNKLSK